MTQLQRYSVMPRFPYGMATFRQAAPDPFAHIPTMQGFGQEVPEPPMPPELPTPTPMPTSTEFPGTFALALVLGGAATAAIGWHMGSAMTTVLGGAAAAWGVFAFPYRETLRWSVGV